jgi:phosphoglycolate phosphatase
METIFFDLDGTLTDPKPGITGSIQYALEKLGRPVPTQDELAWCIGPPLRASFAVLVGEELADQGVAFYRERFGDVGLFENSLYPDIKATLAALSPRARLFVATSKPHVFATRIVEHFGLSPYFEYVFGSELDGTRVHKGDLLAWALERAGTDPARAIMIGDRSHDIRGKTERHRRHRRALWLWQPRGAARGRRRAPLRHTAGHSRPSFCGLRVTRGALSAKRRTALTFPKELP